MDGGVTRPRLFQFYKINVIIVRLLLGAIGATARLEGHMQVLDQLKIALELTCITRTAGRNTH